MGRLDSGHFAERSPGLAPDFAPIAASLAREVEEHLDVRGRRGSLLADRTVATNSDLLPARVAALELLIAAAGMNDLGGRRLLDAGCGFGGIAAYFSRRGASVLALDPNPAVLEACKAVAAEHDLPITTSCSGLQDAVLEERAFDIVVLNNSLCYLQGAQRARALAAAFRSTKPGGVIVIREPNRSFPLDPFTHLPLLHYLPSVVRARAPHPGGKRSAVVRLTSSRQLARELAEAGFVDPATVRRDGRVVPGTPRRPHRRYFELSARRAADDRAERGSA